MMVIYARYLFTLDENFLGGDYILSADECFSVGGALLCKEGWCDPHP
jgi:hypothetical protein